MGLKRKVAITTGGDCEIGWAVTVNLAAARALVVGNDYSNADAATAVVQNIESMFGEALPVQIVLKLAVAYWGDHIEGKLKPVSIKLKGN